MITHKEHVRLTEELAFEVLKDIHKRIGYRQVSSIPKYLNERYGISTSNGKDFLKAMITLKVVAFRGETSQSFYQFNKLEWVEAPPSLEIAKLVLEQKNKTANDYNKISRQRVRLRKLVEEAKPVKDFSKMEEAEIKEEPAAELVPSKYIPEESHPTGITDLSDAALVEELRKRGYEVTATETITIIISL